MKPIPISTSYHDKLFNLDDLRVLVRGAAKALRRFNDIHPFEVLAYSGASGAALAWPLALELNVPICMVRKEGDRGHGANVCEGATRFHHYVIVDDFISSGGTIDRIIEQIGILHRAQCVGILLHSINDGYLGIDYWRLAEQYPVIAQKALDLAMTGHRVTSEALWAENREPAWYVNTTMARREIPVVPKIDHREIEASLHRWSKGVVSIDIETSPPLERAMQRDFDRVTFGGLPLPGEYALRAPTAEAIAKELGGEGDGR